MILKALPIVTTAAILVTPTLVAESGAARTEPFTCQTRNGIPTTVARLADGNVQPIFHWQSEHFGSLNPQQLCNDVTQKLNANAGGKLYGFATQIVAGTPTLCLEAKAGTCTQALFTTEPGSAQDNPLSQVNQILADILDPGFKPPQGAEQEIINNRGFFGARYRVNVLQFL